MAKWRPKKNRLDGYKPRKLVNKAIKYMAMQNYHPVLRADGVLEYKTIPKTKGPWIYPRHYTEGNCLLWSLFFYGMVVKQLPQNKRFVPSPCMGCYKVFIRPESFDELLEVYERMEKLGLPGKCGIEQRDSVDGLYGAYFYCRGLDRGLEVLEQVRDCVSTRAFLKRACTEFEKDYGHSHTWQKRPWQDAIEKEAFYRVYINNWKRLQTEQEKKEMISMWERWAESKGWTCKPSHFYVTYEKGGKINLPQN
jgi:hypothetical protein